VEQHSGEGGDVVATGESPPGPNVVGGCTKDNVHYNEVEHALLEGFHILLSVHLEGKGRGRGQSQGKRLGDVVRKQEQIGRSLKREREFRASTNALAAVACLLPLSAFVSIHLHGNAS